MLKLVSSLLLSVTFGGTALAEGDLRLSIVSSQLDGPTPLGQLHVDGPGEVSFVGQRHGQQVVIHARNPEGEIIGRAETVIGLGQTPIYVLTGGGLEKITIRWGVQ